MAVADIGWIVALIVLTSAGLWAVIAPRSLVWFSRKTARRIHVPYARWLDRKIYVDRIIYRFHRGAGLAIWLGSCAILYLVVFGQGVAGPSASGRSWWLESLVALMTVAGVVGFCFGIVVLLRPSAVKPLETWGNRWVGTPERLLDRPVRRLPLERWVGGHTRLFGLLVLAAVPVIAGLVF